MQNPIPAVKRRLKPLLVRSGIISRGANPKGATLAPAPSPALAGSVASVQAKPAVDAALKEKPQPVILPKDPLADRIIDDAADKRGPSEQVDLSAAVAAQDVESRLRTFFRDSHMEPEKADDYLAEVTCTEAVGIEEVVAKLRIYGLVIFPAIYDADRLKRVQAQYDAMMAEDQQHAYNADERAHTAAHSRAVTFMRNALPEAEYDEIHALFGSKLIEEISQRFFSGQVFDFNPSLYAQWTKNTDVPASGTLHWDKQLTLKSWLYVTDGYEQQGAMRAGIGSNRWLRLLREEIMHEGEGYNAIDNSVDEEGLPIVSTGGPAGTFFLFVTDTAHGASPVSQGHVRNIIRSQARPVRIKQWAAWAAKR